MIKIDTNVSGYTILDPYFQVAIIWGGGGDGFRIKKNDNKWEGLNKRGGRKSTFKIEKFTLIYSKIIIDKANRWIILGKNASNRYQIGVFA